MTAGPTRGFAAYETRNAAELKALTEDDVHALDAANAEAFKTNATLFQAAQQIAEDIDPTNREIRGLTPPEPPALHSEWAAAQDADG